MNLVIIPVKVVAAALAEQMLKRTPGSLVSAATPTTLLGADNYNSKEESTNPELLPRQHLARDFVTRRVWMMMTLPKPPTQTSLSLCPLPTDGDGQRTKPEK